METPTLRPTFTPRPTNTPWPTFTPSPIPTPQGIVSGVTTTTVNVRLGPGTVYPVVSRLTKGAAVSARGRDASGRWVWLVPPPTGWLLVEWVKWEGDVQSLPVVEAPPTPIPTPTLAPTATLAPTPTPRMYVDFRADATLIPAGSCTTLRWDVEGVNAVYLDGRGQPGHGSLEVCTHTTRTFVLHIVPREGPAFNRSVTIAVYAAPTLNP